MEGLQLTSILLQIFSHRLSVFYQDTSRTLHQVKQASSRVMRGGLRGTIISERGSLPGPRTVMSAWRVSVLTYKPGHNHYPFNWDAITVAVSGFPGFFVLSMLLKITESIISIWGPRLAGWNDIITTLIWRLRGGRTHTNNFLTNLSTETTSNDISIWTVERCDLTIVPHFQTIENSFDGLNSRYLSRWAVL